MDLHILPKEIVSKIFTYLRCPIATIMNDEIVIYENDHSYYYTRLRKRFYIKNILSFSDYYFDKLKEPYYYLSYHHSYK